MKPEQFAENLLNAIKPAIHEHADAIWQSLVNSPEGKQNFSVGVKLVSVKGRVYIEGSVSHSKKEKTPFDGSFSVDDKDAPKLPGIDAED